MKRPGLALACAAALCWLPLGAAAHDLLEVWRAAARHDRSFAVARAEHAASQTLREQADALWRPRVGLNLGVGLGANQTAMRGAQFSAPGMGQVGDARFATSVDAGLATRAVLDARQPLLDAGRDAQRARLQGGADMGDTAWHAARTGLMLRTAERYLTLAIAQEQVRVIERQAEALEQARTEAHDRFRWGASPITDTHEADAALANVRARQSAAALELDLQRKVLGDSTGLTRPTARLPMLPPAPADELQAWIHAAETANPRLRLLGQAVGVARQELRQQAAASSATLDLVAQAGHERLGGSGEFGTARNRGLNALVGVQLAIPLYSGGMVQARQREAAERLNQARAELDLAREEVAQQVRAAWLGLQTAAARVTALDAGLQASTARLDATRFGRKVGDRTSMEVLNAENDHAQATLALAQARSDQVLTRLKLAALADRLDEALLEAVDAALAPAPSGVGRP